MRDLRKNLKLLTKLYKISQYTAIGLGVVAAALPLVGLASAIFAVLAFWTNTRRDALKDLSAEDAERLRWRHEEALRELNEQVKAKLESNLCREERKREELERRIYGNVIRS
jgi:hypothetical protein